MSNGNGGIEPEGIAWGKVCGALGAVGLVLGGVWYATADSAEPPKPKVAVAPMASRTRTVVPGYETPQPPQVVQQADGLTPNVGLDQGRRQAERNPNAAPRGPARPREKSYREKLWEAHLEAGIGGTDYEAEDAKAGPKVAAASSGPAGGCFLPPTVPIAVQVEHAGYTERGGMIHGTVAQPALGDGMACTVLPVGSRVSMEFWGEIGDAEVMEIGRPTFASPRTAIRLQPVAGTEEDDARRDLPDHQSGWVMTPTFSLDRGDVITLHLRGELHANPRG